jgi:membrane-associated phospholipid phosphatase
VHQSLASRWRWLLGSLAGAALLGVAFWLDDRVDSALVTAPHSGWRQVAWWCSKFGEGWFPAAIAVFLAAIYLWRDKPIPAAKIFFAALTCEITGLAATILRVIFGRTRPSNHDVPAGFYGLWHDGHWIVGQFKFSSFPSGHAATAAGLAIAAWLLHRGWGAVLAIYAVAVMWSRIALEAHHLSDVVASVLLSVPLAVWSRQHLLPSVEFHFGNLHRKWR